MRTNIEKYKNSSLRSISNNLYSYLKNNNLERININKDFDFDDYKEAVRFELVQFSYSFISLVNLNSEETKEFIAEKAKLKNYVDEILDNEEMLNNFTIYKIQQFINKVAKELLRNDYENFKVVSKNEKYMNYFGIEIDMSNYLGFVTADKVTSYLYKEFNLKRLKQDEYSDAFLLKLSDRINNDPSYLDEINKLLFKAAIDIDNKKHLVIDHPVKDDDSIIRYIEEGCVAERTPKRVYKKVRKDELEEITIDEYFK